MLSLLYQKLTKSQMSKRMETALIISMIAIVGMFGLIVLMVIMNNRNKNEEIAANKRYLNECLQKANSDHDELWKKNCNDNLMLSANCQLPIKIVQILDQKYYTQKDYCYRRFPLQ